MTGYMLPEVMMGISPGLGIAMKAGIVLTEGYNLLQEVGEMIPELNSNYDTIENINY